jgi:probable rRNA maturation factor
MLCLDIRNDCGASTPPADALEEAVRAALSVADYRDAQPEVSLCIVDRETMRELNHRYRHQDRATNVLSFPSDLPTDVPLAHLGDIVVCAPLLDDEARQQGKAIAAHWAHLLIHGTLHLLGYDHIDDAEAARMEALETRALATLGWPCPYREHAA